MVNIIFLTMIYIMPHQSYVWFFMSFFELICFLLKNTKYCKRDPPIRKLEDSDRKASMRFSKWSKRWREWDKSLLSLNVSLGNIIVKNCLISYRFSSITSVFWCKVKICKLRLYFFCLRQALSWFLILFNNK